jgi:hypothetical protein
VHGWYEGRTEGEDTCPGYDYWGQLSKATIAGEHPPETGHVGEA